MTVTDDTTLTREERLELRKAVRGWTDRTRKLRTAYQDAADRRAQAMYAAVSAGIPWATVAIDARIAVPTAIRTTHRWADRQGLPRPYNKETQQ